MAKKIPDLRDVRKSIRFITVYHTKMNEAIVRAEECFAGAGDGGDPRGLLVLGASGAGKSRVLEEVAEKHPSSRNNSGVIMPLMDAKIPPNPTVKGLATELLNILGDPLFDKDTEQVKTIRLRKLMKYAGVKVLMLDEFQHFVDQGGRSQQHHVADWLKVLVDDLQISLIVAGLPYSQQVVEINPQLKRRFYEPVCLPSFDWRIQEQRDEFVSILDAMQGEISGVNFPDLATSEMAFKIHCATGGILGRVSNLLIEASSIAISKTGRNVTIKMLGQAAARASFDLPGSVKTPFEQRILLDQKNRAALP